MKRKEQKTTLDYPNTKIAFTMNQNMLACDPIMSVAIDLFKGL